MDVQCLPHMQFTPFTDSINHWSLPTILGDGGSLYAL